MDSREDRSSREGDSRKRPLDSDGDSGLTKRSNQGFQSSSGDPNRDDIHLKIMVPSFVAGAVIGKGGETIGRLQRETSAKIKMSKNQDTFPGTTERVCLVVGSVQACADVHAEIAQMLSDKPDPHPRPGSDGDNKVNYERHKQTKILIPNSTAGVIIGKGGAYIRELKERSDAYVSVSAKTDNPERIVTISGDPSHIHEAMMLILEKLAGDPQSGSCYSINYSDMNMHSAHNTSFGRSGMLTPSQSMSGLADSSRLFGGGSNTGHGNMTPQQVQAAAQGLGTMMRNFSGLGSGINNLNIGGHRRGLNPATEQLIQTLRLTGYTETAAEEIALALATLANYNLLSLFGGGQLLGNLMNLNRLSLNSSAGSTAGSNTASQVPSVPSLLAGASTSCLGEDGILGSYTTISGSSSHKDDGSSLLRQLTQSLSRNQNGKSSDVFGPVGSSSATSNNPASSGSGGITSLFGGDGLFPGGNYNSSGADNDNSFGLGSSGSPEPHDSQDIEVGENLAGAIIGQGGRGITELQSMTGASVTVSKRGVYAPGTSNRVVTVTGPTSSVRRAADLVRQRISDAEQRRTSSY